MLMLDYGFAEEPAFAAALRRLARLRTRERRLRIVLQLWSLGLIAWVLPLGNWSAGHLSKPVTVTVAALFAGVGLWLLLKYRALSRAQVLDPAELENQQTHWRPVGAATGDVSAARRGVAGTRSAPPRAQ